MTANLKDFPKHAVKLFDLSVVSPDDFLLDQLDLYPAPVLHCLEQQANRYVLIHGPSTVGELCTALDRAGVPKFAAEVRRNVRRS
ncbi:hypothetical protein ACLFMI_03255 [Pseudonocardia nantongensis]|uniref:hypothetical protein n=1 Tax=Pseudonocardia nantongensis TaxID=1181885 RepID=UPI003978BF16